MDNHVLSGPGGASPVNVGSWLQAQPGPDYGAKDLLRSTFFESPAGEGGVLGFESRGVRRMSFPLLLASGGAGLSLTGLESLLRLTARPGGYLDIQPQGVPSAEAVRFDVLAGRWEEDYGIRLNEVGVRLGALKLDVQPLGYWPTEILLASVASVALPGSLVIPGASVIGDVPGAVHLRIKVDQATGFYGAGAGASYSANVLGFSFGGRASQPAFLHPASIGFSTLPTNAAASLMGEAFAPASQVYRVFGSPTTSFASWHPVFAFQIASTLEPAFRGRYRLFAWLRAHPSQALPYSFSADVDGLLTSSPVNPLASAAPVASLAPMAASGAPVGAFGAVVGSAMTLLDLGEITAPKTGSGLPQQTFIRVWGKAATTNVGIATPILDCGGFFLQSLAGPAGLMPRGLTLPSVSSNVWGPAWLVFETARAYQTVDTASPAPVGDPLQWYRGPTRLRVAASTARLDVFTAGHPGASGASDNPMVHSGQFSARMAVSYQPRFTFLKGI